MLTLPIIDVVNPRPPYLPLAIPADLADRLTRLHGDPSVWFTAQFVRYLMRPQQHLQNDLDAFVKRVQLRNPCVGYVSRGWGWKGMGKRSGSVVVRGKGNRIGTV